MYISQSHVLALSCKRGFEIPLQASLDATKGELEKWTNGFTNDSLLPPGVTPGIFPLHSIDVEFF